MKKLLMTTALAVVSLTGAYAAAKPSSVIVFGDSSADLGTFGPETRPTNQGEMWSERISRRISLPLRNARSIRTAADGTTQIQRQDGTSYAINGSTALPFDGVFTLKDQVDFFIADKRQFAEDDLVFVWVTRNDITTAAAIGVTYNPNAYAQAVAGQVDRIMAAGAQNIVAFGAETQLIARQYALDLGATTADLDQLRSATVASEAALWPLLAERDVFILDIDRLGNDVIANPARYGFRATTDSYQGRGDPMPKASQAYVNDGNVFTLDGHYTSAMQAVVADFALAQLRGREQFADTVRAIDGDFRIAHASAAAAAREGRRVHSGAESGWRVFGGVAYGAGRQDSVGGLDPRGEDDGYGLLIGADAMVAEGLIVGAQLSGAKRDGKFAENTGRTARQTGVLSVYGSQALGAGFSVEGSASTGIVSLDRFERRATLGDTAQARALGDTAGSFLGARLGLAYAVQLAEWGVEVGGGVSAERTRLDAFSEAPGVLALSFGAAVVESVWGDAQAKVRYGAPDIAFSPYVSVRYQHAFNDEVLALDIGPTATTRATWRTDQHGDSAVALEVGATYRVGTGMVLKGSIEVDKTDTGDEATALRISLSRAF